MFPTPPPMIQSRFTFCAIDGSRTTAAAMFVSGACASSVQLAGRLVDAAHELVDGVLGPGPPRRLREEGVAHAVLAVHVRGIDPVGDERLRAARIHGHALAGLLDGVERVLDLLVEARRCRCRS